MRQALSEVRLESEKLSERLPNEAELQAQYLKALAAQRALASHDLADALARESAKRREEHDSVVCTLRAQLLSTVGELGLARASCDRLVADRGLVMEAHATTADPQLLVEVLVLRERMTQAIIEKRERQEASVLAASHFEGARVAHGISLETARVAHGLCREELILKSAQVMYVSADLDRSREATAKHSRERELLATQLAQQQREYLAAMLRGGTRSSMAHTSIAPSFKCR